MKNKGFTLIELLAVIVVLAIVMVLAATTVMPYMSTAREDSFRLEATGAVESAINAKSFYEIGSVKLNSDSTKSCASDAVMCFTISELISIGLYDSDPGTFSGKVEITNLTSKTPTYTLYLNKKDEYKIINQTHLNYSDNGTLSTDEWKDEYETCSCS